MSIETSVADHYTHGSLAQAIFDALRNVVPDFERITIADLAPVDEFHIGGREATRHFIEQLDFAPDMHVVDVGAGIGGTARYVAQTKGCRVSGIDLTEEFCAVGKLLTEKVRLDRKVTHHHGSALDMPFEDETFDGAYTVHVAMNIADKPLLYREIHRVLRPDARFGIYDVLRGEHGDELNYPVPWATGPETSFLASRDELADMLDEAGFDIESETNRTAYALDYFHERVSQAADGPPPIGTHLLMRDFKTKFANMLSNVEQGSCGPWEIVCRRR